MVDPVKRIFRAEAERSEEDPPRFRWVLFTSDDTTAHSRSYPNYPTRDAALADARAIAAVLAAAIGYGNATDENRRPEAQGRPKTA